MTTTGTVGQIEIQYQNATLGGGTASIGISGGGSFVLTENAPLQFNGTFSIASLKVTCAAISFNNAVAGNPINGTVSASVSATTDPVITVTDFTGHATLSWQTPQGPQYRPLSAGDPVTLNGFVG